MGTTTKIIATMMPATTMMMPATTMMMPAKPATNTINDDGPMDDDDVSKGNKSPNNPTLNVAEIFEKPNNGTDGYDSEPSVSDDVLDELTEMGTFQRDRSASLVLSDLLHKNELFQKRTLRSSVNVVE
jgi:hypothetical protein